MTVTAQVIIIAVMSSQARSLRAELGRANTQNGHQKDDNVRLQVCSPSLVTNQARAKLEPSRSGGLNA